MPRFGPTVPGTVGTNPVMPKDDRNVKARR